jgi:hypothetical protein
VDSLVKLASQTKRSGVASLLTFFSLETPVHQLECPRTTAPGWAGQGRPSTQKHLVESSKQLRADDLVQPIDHLLQFLDRNAPEFLAQPLH